MRREMFLEAQRVADKGMTRHDDDPSFYKDRG